MDHLPPPIDHEGHERVHFYASQLIDEYKPQDFYTLPQKYGYNDFQNLIEEGLNDFLEEDRANEFIQSWLWFALLAQVIGSTVYRTDFHRSDDTIGTKMLNTYISSWVERENEAAEDSDQPPQASKNVGASMALEVARRFVAKHCAHDSIDRDGRPRVQSESECPFIGCSVDLRLNINLTLSIAILGETLQLARPTMSSGLEYHGEFHHEPNTEENHFWGYSRYCRRSLKNNKWCPFAVRRIESRRQRVTSIYLVCQMKPPKPDCDHSACTIWGCVAPRQPQTALHMGGCGGKCRTDKIPESKLVEWISQDKIPLIMWTEAKGMESTGHDLKKEKGILFVAMTHTWGDGLIESGKDARNKNDRCMHSCQVERVQLTCNRLLKEGHLSDNKEVYLWIDVLCMPREASVRGKAINHMKVIYSKAAKVLVWDRNLLQSRKTSSPIEMNTRIRMSKWAQRLWTLQEAILAKDLHIQFQDETVSVKELEEARDQARDDIDHPFHHVWKAGEPFSLPVWKLRQPDEECRVQRTWEAVQFRSVTDPRDETIILANVLKLDVTRLEHIGDTPEEIVQESHDAIADKRMGIFLDMLDEAPDLGIPSGIIFFPPPKLPVDGYGWAPRTWLSKQSRSSPLMRPLRQEGSIMKNGLLVEFPGLILHCPHASLENEIFWIPVQQGLHEWYKIVADRGNDGENFKDFWETYVHPHGESLIIMSTSTISHRWEVGVLVNTKGFLTKGKVRWVRILCRVWIRLETNTNVIRREGDLFREKGGIVIFGERLESQKWCIDGTVEPEAAPAFVTSEFSQKRRRTLNSISNERTVSPGKT